MVVLIVAMAEHFQGLTARKNVTLINLYSLILTLASPGFPQQKSLWDLLRWSSLTDLIQQENLHQ